MIPIGGGTPSLEEKGNGGLIPVILHKEFRPADLLGTKTERQRHDEDGDNDIADKPVEEDRAEIHRAHQRERERSPGSTGKVVEEDRKEENDRPVPPLRKGEIRTELPDREERDKYLQKAGKRPDDRNPRVLHYYFRSEKPAEERPDIRCNRPVGTKPEREEDHRRNREVDCGNAADPGREECLRDPREGGIDENHDQGQDDKGVRWFLFWSQKIHLELTIGLVSTNRLPR